MSTLTYEAIGKMDAKARESKLQELRLELVKSRANHQKTGTKTKEIKKAIARLLTFANAGKQLVKKQ